jgi:hypothetical protein
LAEFQKKHKPLQTTVHKEKILVDFIKPHQYYTQGQKRKERRKNRNRMRRRE